MPVEKKKPARRSPADTLPAPAPVPVPEGLALSQDGLRLPQGGLRLPQGGLRLPQGGLRLPQGGLRLLAYLLALFPLYGFVLGVIYTPQPNPASKQFGHRCFLLAVVGLVGMVFLWGLGTVWKSLTAVESGGMGGGYF